MKIFLLLGLAASVLLILFGIYAIGNIEGTTAPIFAMTAGHIIAGFVFVLYFLLRGKK